MMNTYAQAITHCYLHFPANEWHVFEYKEGGRLTIAYFYPSARVYSAAFASTNAKK